MDSLRQKMRRQREQLLRGISRRWLVNGLGVMILLIALLCVMGMAAVRYYYYQQVQSLLYSRAGVLAARMESLSDEVAFDFESSARSFVETFTDRETMELQMLDRDGGVMMSSTGFSPGRRIPADFRSARVAGKGWSAWRGKASTGEQVMGVSVMVTGSGGVVYGAVRCVTSLTLVNRQISTVIVGLLLLSALVLLSVLASNLYFVGSILGPVKEIGSAARRVALGDYGFRLKKQHDDELGDLADTINYMAGEIQLAERTKNEFIASVSHELRTPLTAIKGWSETLLGAVDDRELTEKGLQVIAGEAERLSGIVEELLDFSGMQSGRRVLKTERLDLQAELEDAVFLFRERAEQERVRLQFVENEDIPPVTGDRDRLRQVFVNLLDNALKYSDPGDRVRVEAASMGSRVQVVISDTGHGIAREELPRVTEKFYRVDRRQPGSGIGLALVEEIVRQHGGQLEIDSEQGKGTTVVITLPCEKNEKGEGATT